MIKNYFKTAWRNIIKNKFYASINIIGLTIGLTVGLLILLWVNDELSYDSFNTKAENIYRINSQIGTGASKRIWGGVQAPIATYALREIPGVQNAVRLVKNDEYSIYKYGDKELTAGDHDTYYTDPSIFKIFDFKLLKGNALVPFPNDQSVVISETNAKKFFGDADPIGKVLIADNKDDYTVTGVMADAPDNSTIKPDMLFSIGVKARQYTGKDYWKSMEEDWGNYYAFTYLLMQPGFSDKSVEDKLYQIHIQHQPGAQSNKVKYILQPLTKIHLYNLDGSASAMQTVKIFLIIAVIILIIACINYVNLSTARAMLRSKEVGVRKIIGAARVQLFAQFIIETILFFGIALVLAICLIEALMPFYNEVAGKQMQLNLLDPELWGVIGLTVLTTLTISSIYPALLLSSFKPISVLKGKISTGLNNVSFRKVLVLSQFIFSSGLIIGTIIVYQQLEFIRDKKLGFDRSQVFDFESREMEKNYEAVRADLIAQKGVLAVTSSDENIVNVNNTTGDTDWDGKELNSIFIIHPIYADQYYFNFFKMPIVQGKGFDGSKSDSAHFILNETAIKEAGIKDPIGKRFKLYSTSGTIIGVVKDFHFASLKQKIEPAIFGYRPGNSQIYIKTVGKDAPSAIAGVRQLWNKYNPGFPFEYHFLDETYDNLYKSDQRSGTLFGTFAVIAILISCLGLFGLATYTAQVKVKEIGIRKILGASVPNILIMLSKDFLSLVLLSFFIASPVAWYGMSKWLQDYAYRIQIQWWVFALSGCLAVLIAFITISFQAIKAALANPVKSLRSE